jgi:alpha-L-fucosidase
MELIGFIHFSINTFTDKEWGYGDEDPKLFNPTGLDAGQWAETAKLAGMKQLILTAKHHDGFCLWPSKYTEHSVKNSPYKDGKGDVVKEFVEACRKHGLKAGLYLSPWDRNHRDYGKPEYITYYRNQLEELLTQYGEISEIWFDGANGGDGYYGGANEVRHIDRSTYYDWETTIPMVKAWQPGIMVFSDAGPDVHWIGNEHGFAGEEFWSTITTDSIIIGAANTAYLNRGDPQGKEWVVGQCDVSIRPGWFYHKSQDSLVKSPEELVDIYFKSVGRNAVLLLNLPPDKRGLIHENDVDTLKRFREILDESFKDNLVRIDDNDNNNINDNDNINISNNINIKDNNNIVSGNGLFDGDFETYWEARDTAYPVELIIEFPETEFDVIMLQEPIWLGQRVSRFNIYIENDNGWSKIAEGSTIGYKRLLKFEAVISSKIKIEILEANSRVALSTVGIFY